MTIRTQVAIHHSKDCHQCARVDGEPPDFYFNGEFERRDRSGRTSRGSRRFLVVKCNAINCSALVLVSEKDLIALLSKNLAKVSR